MSTAKNTILCIRIDPFCPRFQGDHIDHTRPPFDCRTYITTTFFHCRFTITICQVGGGGGGNSRLVASEKLDVSPSTATTATDLGASGRRMALLCAAGNTCTEYKVMASRWTARSSMEKRGDGAGRDAVRGAPAGESVISSSPPTPRRALPL